MAPAHLRRAQRRFHLASAVVLLAYVYAPLDAQLGDLVRFVALPVLTLTGIAMWQAARIRRLVAAGPRSPRRRPARRGEPQG